MSHSAALSRAVPRDPVAVTSDAIRRAGKELLPAIVVAALTSLAAQWVITKMPLPRNSQVPTALSTLSISILAIAILLLTARSCWPRWATPVSWALPGLVGTVWLSFVLANSNLYLGGLSWDQTHRVQYLTRLTDSAALADLNYADLPPFYPAGWFWVGGRFADLLGLPGWEAYKPYAILTIAVAAAVVFVLWSIVVPRKVALLLATAATLVAIRGAAYEPYSWAMLAMLPPLALLAWKLFRSAGHRRVGGVTGSVVLLGAALGISASVYTLVFGFFCFLLVAFAAVAVELARRRKTVAVSVALRAVLGRLVGVGLVALPFILAAWLPYLLAALRGSPASGTALRYLPESGAEFPLPMLQFSVSGAICLAGTGWLLLAWRRSMLARVLSGVALLCYAWYALSTVALVRELTLLPFRIEPLLELTLWCAGVFAGLDLMRLLGRRYPHVFEAVPSLPKVANPAVPKRNLVAAVLALLAVVSLTQTVDTEEKLIPGFLDAARTDYDLSGTNAAGESDPDEDGYWARQLVTTIDELTGQREPSELVLLTTYNDLLAFRPYHGFQTTIAGWSNPLADYEARTAKIDALARSGSAAELVNRLRDSEFAAPSVFVLRREAGALTLRISFDIFPAEPNMDFREVSFDPKLFDSPEFTRRDVGPFAVITRAAGPDLSSQQG